jgi:uncharacterized membrane protein YphA (DoxX/SURF4 family)
VLSEEAEREPEAEVVFSASPFRPGRALFGGVLAFMALDNLRNLQGRTQYAKSKGAPAPEWTVPANSLGLLLGGLGVALWRLPRASAIAVAGFFLSVTPMMHDFWNAEDDEQKQQEMTQFLKNSALLGAALTFLNLAAQRNRE